MPTLKQKLDSHKTYFDRWALGWQRTWAYRLFKSHHTQLNSLYWSHIPALRYVFAATKGQKRDAPATSLLTLPVEDATRINISLGDWGKHYNDFDNWVRLNALVAITGYLEVYLKTATRLALESDPGMLVGVKHGIDGVVALKQTPKYSFADSVVGCVKGTWHERIAQYSRLFGQAPAIFHSNIRELERLRSIRNGVTHSFGRATDDYDSLFEVRPKPFKKVTEERLKQTLHLADKIAQAVDNHLGTQHIGAYEALYFYHQWDKAYSKGDKTEAKALAQLMGALHGRAKNIRYFEDLITYYNGL